MLELIFEKLTPNVKLPEYGTSGAAGMDVFAPRWIDIYPGEQILIKSGLKVKIPTGHFLRVVPKSGLSLKYELDTRAGLIDEDFSGELGIILYNGSKKIIQFEQGMKIAQMVLQRYERAVIKEGKVEQSGDRIGGFGSTGV